MNYYREPPFDDRTSPFYRQEKISLFLEKNELPIDLLDPEAESIVKKKGDKYLIRRPAKVESQDAFDKRLESATLINAYADGVDSWVSMVGAAGVRLADDAKSDLSEMVFELADRAGNSLNIFAKKYFRKGVGEGAGFAVIDGPQGGGTATRTDAASLGRRPWLYLFGVNQLLGWEELGGKVVEVRYFWTEAVKDDGYAEKVVWKAREYVVPEGRADGIIKVKTWTWDNSLSEPEEVILPLDRIPVVPFLPGSEIGQMLSFPPAARLATQTKAYYNSWSLQQNFGVIARTPLLTVIGATVKEVLHSLGSVLSLGNKTRQEAEAGYIEPSGVGAEFGWKDLEKIENAFRYWGVELERQDGTVLATTKIIDNSRMVEKVRSWSGELEKALQSCMEIAMSFYGEQFPKNGIKIGTEYGVPSLTNEQVQMLKLAIDSEQEWVFDLAKKFVPQIGDVTWEEVQDATIQNNQLVTLPGLDTGIQL